MCEINLNALIGIFGGITMLTGLVFLQTNLIAVPLTGIGGSILATAVVNWILTINLYIKQIGSIIESIGNKIQILRTHHEIELEFTIEKGFVRIDKRHRYHLFNLTKRKKERKISMYTDASGVTDDLFGGFTLIIGPDGGQLEKKALSDCVKYIQGKHVFEQFYYLQPGDENKFEFRSYDYFRNIDRLIWTVEDIADDLELRIKNKTGVKHPFTVKINHHREKEIKEQIKTLDESEEILIRFNHEILPFQGFEIMWNIDASAI